MKKLSKKQVDERMGEAWAYVYDNPRRARKALREASQSIDSLDVPEAVKQDYRRRISKMTEHSRTR